MQYVYMVKCKDGSFYTGWTTNLESRLEAHNKGRGAKYTKGRSPVELLYLEVFDDKISALKREAGIKKLSRSKKELLILGNKLRLWQIRI